MSIHYLISFDLTHGKFHVDTEDEAESFVFTPAEAAKLTGESQKVQCYLDGEEHHVENLEDGQPDCDSDYMDVARNILRALGRHFKTTDTQIVRLP